MIQVHVMELFAKPDLLDSTLGRTSLFLGGPFVAPVFLACMGFFIAFSSRSSLSLFWRGVKLFGGGLLLNLGLNAHLFWKIYSGQLIIDPWPFVFGVDILVCAGLSTIAVSLVQSLFGRHYLVYALLCTASLVATSHLAKITESISNMPYLTAAIGGDHAWSYFPVFPWISYVLLGAFAGHGYHGLDEAHRSRVFAPWVRGLAFVVCLAVLIPFRKFGIETSTNLGTYYHHDWMFFLWNLPLLTLLCIVANETCQRIGGWSAIKDLRWIGQNVTLCYVIQWLIIGNIATSIYKTQGGLNSLAWAVAILSSTCWIASQIVALKAIVRKTRCFREKSVLIVDPDSRQP